MHVVVKKLLSIGLLFFIVCNAFSQYDGGGVYPKSTKQQAQVYVQHAIITTSNYWPHINPALFKNCLETYIRNTVTYAENKNTNLCGYTAITDLTGIVDPLTYVKKLIELYEKGAVQYGDVLLKPSVHVRNYAGTLKYEGALEINPASQMWYLTLADHFKGYLNILKPAYKINAETTLWASTNFSKFNRMLRHLLGIQVRKYGSDLFRPRVGDLYTFLSREVVADQHVFLYLNNRLLYKKKEPPLHFDYPTHYVLLQKVERVGNLISIEYIDSYGHTVQQLTAGFLKKIVFGISICSTPLP